MIWGVPLFLETPIWMFRVSRQLSASCHHKLPMMESATCDGESKGLVKGRNLHQQLISSGNSQNSFVMSRRHRFYPRKSDMMLYQKGICRSRMLYHRDPKLTKFPTPMNLLQVLGWKPATFGRKDFYITHKTVVGIDGRTQAVSPSGGCSIPWHSRHWKPHTRRLEGQNLIWITRWHRYQTSHTSCIIHQWFGVLLALPGRIDIKRMILPMFLWEACYCNNELTWLGMVSNPQGILTKQILYPDKFCHHWSEFSPLMLRMINDVLQIGLERLEDPNYPIPIKSSLGKLPTSSPSWC